MTYYWFISRFVLFFQIIGTVKFHTFLRSYEEIEGRCLSYSLKYAYCKYG